MREVESDDALLVEIPFDRNIALTLRQVDRSQIPDLPDRIIAATALYLNVPVISRDRRIQLSRIKYE
ncbi:PIN domain-containing protein [Microcoleus sp. LAD1_D5]|uniref:PIN domain-containing protein n=1 Tax=unclassified Microcoleus TaxID=2642155 RepID=UPI002FD12151